MLSMQSSFIMAVLPLPCELYGVRPNAPIIYTPRGETETTTSTSAAASGMFEGELGGEGCFCACYVYAGINKQGNIVVRCYQYHGNM
jgi:hypothetical protein